ncbi:hypothetical protein F4804DRAFT_234884 [Jackrogersella minutella]|nr:hypothetical protein F4804DRAFT_234884 [Jackrogersella minutella]
MSEPTEQPTNDGHSSQSPLAEDTSVRLKLNDFDLRLQATKLVKSGSSFSKVPCLKEGGSNWNEFNTGMLDAALTELCIDVLNGTTKRPIPPPVDCSTQTWNTYVKEHAHFCIMNSHLLGNMRSRLSPTVRRQQEVDLNPDAHSVYQKLKEYSRQRGANHLLDLSYALTKKTLPQTKGIEEYNSHWDVTCQAIDSLQLDWKIPDELKQLWYLANLGDAFESWKTSITTRYAIAGIGTGSAITLNELMPLAHDHWTKLAGNAKRSAASMSAYHLDDADSDNEVYFNKRGRHDNSSNEKRSFQKRNKPDHYKGPNQKVCSVHGWLNNPKSNHDDSTCRYLKFKRGEEQNAYFQSDQKEESSKPDNLPLGVGLEGNHFTDWDEAVKHLNSH